MKKTDKVTKILRNYNLLSRLCLLLLTLNNSGLLKNRTQFWEKIIQIILVLPVYLLSLIFTYLKMPTKQELFYVHDEMFTFSILPFKGFFSKFLSQISIK